MLAKNIRSYTPHQRYQFVLKGLTSRQSRRSFIKENNISSATWYKWKRLFLKSARDGFFDQKRAYLLDRLQGRMNLLESENRKYKILQIRHKKMQKRNQRLNWQKKDDLRKIENKQARLNELKSVRSEYIEMREENVRLKKKNKELLKEVQNMKVRSERDRANYKIQLNELFDLRMKFFKPEPIEVKSPQKKLEFLKAVKVSTFGTAICKFLGHAYDTFHYWKKRHEKEGMKGLVTIKRRKLCMWESKELQDAISELIHSPPTSYGSNRTSWTNKLVRKVLEKNKKMKVGEPTIRKVFKALGYSRRSSKEVLTSHDPMYKEKVAKITNAISSLGRKDRFFSIDEMGPMQIIQRGGRKLVKKGEIYKVPKFQKSKGSLILTAALEIKTNQITHFYSKTKNTNEMILLIKKLLLKYKGCRNLFLTWDDAPWHRSNKLKQTLKDVNDSEYRKKRNTPKIIILPLPSGAQFLNIIEAVFSGLAKAVIHNSNYASVDEAKKAIDRYFRERNRYFKKYPKKAGKKIWKVEKTKCEFKKSGNYKDQNIYG